MGEGERKKESKQRNNQSGFNVLIAFLFCCYFPNVNHEKSVVFGQKGMSLIYSKTAYDYKCKFDRVLSHFGHKLATWERNNNNIEDDAILKCCPPVLFCCLSVRPIKLV